MTPRVFTQQGEAPDLPAGPIEVSQAVLSHLTRSGDLEPTTVAAYAEHIDSFGAFLERGLGIRDLAAVEPGDIRTFLHARRSTGEAPPPSMPQVRFKSVRTFFGTARDLGLTRWDPTERMEPPPRSHETDRPLSDGEVARCRSHSLGTLGDLRRPLAWALSEATAITSEIGAVRVEDVTDDGSHVWLWGATTRDERWGRLTGWGEAQVRRRLDDHPGPEEPLVLWRKTPKEPRAASSQAILETLRCAEVYAADVSPRSVPAWAGRSAFDGGASIDEVAVMLGMRSLDQTARFIGIEWRRHDG